MPRKPRKKFAWALEAAGRLVVPTGIVGECLRYWNRLTEKMGGNQVAQAFLPAPRKLSEKFAWALGLRPLVRSAAVS